MQCPQTWTGKSGPGVTTIWLSSPDLKVTISVEAKLLPRGASLTWCMPPVIHMELVLVQGGSEEIMQLDAICLQLFGVKVDVILNLQIYYLVLREKQKYMADNSTGFLT